MITLGPAVPDQNLSESKGPISHISNRETSSTQMTLFSGINQESSRKYIKYNSKSLKKKKKKSTINNSLLSLRISMHLS